jgi:hypothetical protein
VTVCAVERVGTGVFNVAEPSALVSGDKARRELGWSPTARA